MPTSINFFEEATALKEQLVAWRRDIHQMPEIGLETPKTSSYIQSELAKLGIPFHTIINGSGVRPTGTCMPVATTCTRPLCLAPPIF